MTGASLRRILWPKTLAGKAGAAAMWLLVACVTVFLIARHRMATRLADGWAKFERQGLRPDLIELLGPYVPPDRNAAVPMDEAAKLAGTFLAVLQKQGKVAQRDIYDGVPNAVAAVDALASDSSYDALLCEADRRQEYYTPLVFAAPLVNTSYAALWSRTGLRDAERLIALRLAATGRREEAVERLLRLHRLTRKWTDKEPYLFIALIHAAIRVTVVDALNDILRRGGPMRPEVHDAIEAEIGRNETALAVLPRAELTELLFVYDDLDHDPLAVYPVASLVNDYRKARAIENAYRIPSQWDKPFTVIRQEWRSLRRERNESMKTNLEARLNWAAYQTCDSAYSRAVDLLRLIAKSRCLRIVNAWARRGDFTVAPAALGLPAVCVIDPFDQQPLRVRYTPQGPVVYSVDENLKDDGGVWNPPAADNFESFRPDDALLGPPKMGPLK